MAHLHLMHNGARHQIARRQFGQRMILRHKTVHLNIAQIAALALQRLRQQKSRSLLQDTAP